MFGLNAWARFWRIEAPFATPPLIWNMMMSMSGGWFFVTDVRGHQRGQDQHRAARHRLLDRASPSRRRTCPPSSRPSCAMLVVILIYDQLLFRPLVAWADRFRIGSETVRRCSRESWALTRLSPLAACWTC